MIEFFTFGAKLDQFKDLFDVIDEKAEQAHGGNADSSRQLQSLIITGAELYDSILRDYESLQGRVKALEAETATA